MEQFDRDRLAAKLRDLAARQIYIGASSWKYPGWIGQVYTENRYLTRNKFSRKKFDESCIAEYAETFSIVCGDFSFYQFPSEEFWQRFFSTAPPHLKVGLKTPEEITCKRYPAHPRYGARAGQPNPSFLNAEIFKTLFLEPLSPYQDRMAVVILEFGAFSAAAYPKPSQFYADLDGFVSKLPKTFRYAVEIRNESFLRPEYFKCSRIIR